MAVPVRVAGIVATSLALLLSGTAQGENASHAPDPAIDRVQKEIEKLRQSLTHVRTRARSVEQELEQIELELAVHTRQLNLAVDAQQEVETEKAGIESKIASLSPRLEQQKRYLAHRLDALYRLGPMSYLRMLLSLDTKQDPIEAVQMLRYLIARDAATVTEFQSTRRRLLEERSALAEKSRSVQVVQQLVARQREQMERSRRQKASLLERLRAESTDSARRLAELQEKARRLEKLFAYLYGSRSSESPSPATIDEFKGALEWPVQGEVLEHFGRQRDPRFATVTSNNGLKIAAPPGTPIHVVFEGTVLFSQWFKGYGNLIVVDHGDRVFSLYGNTKNTKVSVGRQVHTGEVIGEVAEGEGDAPSTLYFEIRDRNQPADPEKWLR
ncbi:MAG: peptidoglycan DD-metalloendopeptidase family protein [Thermoanaerobaculia bacterium]